MPFWLLATVVAVAAIGVGTASAQNIQSITGKIKPNKKLPKTGSGKPVSVFISVSSTNPSDPFGLASPAVLGKIDVDKDVKIQNKGLATCNPGEFGSATTTAQAKSLCPDSGFGKGSATVAVPTGPATPPLVIPAAITAFNGKATSIILHTYNSLSGAQTLIAKVRKKDAAAGGKYGQTLTVPIPPLAGGTARITEFNVTVKKTYRFKGKKRTFAAATCKNKKIDFQARFSFQDGTSDTGVSTQKCTGKKS